MIISLPISIFHHKIWGIAVATPHISYTIIVDDIDELEEALSKKDITQEQFNLAVETSHRLQREMLSNIPSFIEYTKRCYEMIRKLRN